MSEILNGILVIDKPQNMTSHDVVALLRRKLKTKKIGHTGTLDPMATGVLPVCIGRATKVVDYLSDRKKGYACDMVLGASTDTQDQWGEILFKGESFARMLRKCFVSGRISSGRFLKGGMVIKNSAIL